MNYRELLELYKTGKLDSETQKQIQTDLEKHDALTDYLYEEAQIPGLDDILQGTSNYESEDNLPTEDTKFITMVQRSIRKAFLKMGIIVGISALVITLAVIFLLPHAVSLFYYNPTEIVGTDSGFTTDRMSLDLSVYTEAFLPGYYRGTVIAEYEGYGKYNIIIPQTTTFNSRFTSVSGKLTREKLTLYDTNQLKAPTGNAFIYPPEVDGVARAHYENGDVEIGPAGSKEEAFARLEALDETEWYMAYISFAEITDYETFFQWYEEKNLTCHSLWCGVYTSTPENYKIDGNTHTGFMPYVSGHCLDWDRETYPRLSLLDCLHESNYQADAASADVMKTHFTSMLRYLNDNPKITKMMRLTTESIDYNQMLQSIERDGLRLYGFAVGAQKEALLELCKDPAVSYIYTTVLY